MRMKCALCLLGILTACVLALLTSPGHAVEEPGTQTGEQNKPCAEGSTVLIAEAPEGSVSEAEGQPAEDIRSRGAFRKASPPQQMTGAVINGNKAIASPGYQFVRGPGNQVYLQRDGAGISGTYDCYCMGSSGKISCPTSTDGRVLTCGFAGGCTQGGCKLETTQSPGGGTLTRPALPPGARTPVPQLPLEKTP